MMEGIFFVNKNKTDAGGVRDYAVNQNKKKLAVYIYFSDAFPTRLSGGEIYNPRLVKRKGRKRISPPPHEQVWGGNILKNVQRANL
jgi:hypothetical protein